MEEIGIGLIGTGFMGKAHAFAYRTVKTFFGDVPASRLAVLCDQPLDKARLMADQFGFSKATDDWRALIDDPAVDIVCITTPNKLHSEIALAALAAGKHVHCEKPMALTLEDATTMAEAARTFGGKTIVGYNYIANPAFQHARKLIADGVIGRPVHFRGFVDEDYQADPETPWNWRATKGDAGLGALGDIGCHLVSMMTGLMGPVARITGDIDIIHKTRPLADGFGHKPVENEDVASALVRFESGVSGVISSSRSAWGRKNYLAFEVHATHGMIRFDQERLNELQIFVNTGDSARDGFTTVLTGPAHEPYGALCPAQGHQLGFNELKTIEVHGFLKAIAEGGRAFPDFDHALEFERVVHAIARSAETGKSVFLKPALPES